MQNETRMYLTQWLPDLKNIIIYNLLENHDKLHSLIHIGSAHFAYISLLLHKEKCKDQLTLCGLVTPYRDRDLGQHWLRQWLVTWRHQAIIWTNVHFSLVRFCVTDLRAILQEVLINLILNMCLKITLPKFLMHLPGANELKDESTPCTQR